jgi:hypothetical protein
MQIGPITLSEFEIPQSIAFGGRYRLAIHRSAFGTRVIEPLGPDDGDIQFQGIFSGPQAEDRARTINNLRLGGYPILLSWNRFQYNVIISKFDLTYRNPSWILYKATCVIVDQPDAGALPAQSIQAQIAADFGNAQTTAAMLGIEITQIAPQIAEQRSFPAGSTTFNTAKSQLSSASTQITAAMAGPADSVSNSDVLSGLKINTTELANIVTNAGLLAYGCLANAYIGRIQRLL